MENKTLYSACPICARKLCKGESGSTVEIFCPRCSTIVRVEYGDNYVLTTVLDSRKKNTIDQDKG